MCASTRERHNVRVTPAVRGQSDRARDSGGPVCVWREGVPVLTGGWLQEVGGGHCPDGHGSAFADSNEGPTEQR